MFVSAIIAAGGRGVRLGADAPKQLLEIGGRPMLQRTVETFLRAACVHEIVVALPPDLASDPPAYLRGPSKPLHVVPGGVRRQDSVAAAFARVSAEAEVVVVHDAARPFVTEGLVERTIDAARMAGAAIAAVPVRDTVKEIAHRAGADEVQTVARTLPRDRLVLAQTPQAFRREVLEAALAFARRNGVEVTDEAALAEQAGYAVRLVAGEPQNVKITTPDDLRAARDAAGAAGPRVMRVGTGYDLHRLAAGRPFVLAGVTIASPVGPVGHSDADVLCHAITDALLGAAARGDIGSHFPDTDERWRGAAGLDLLSRAVDIVRGDGLAVVNVDAVVIAERPRLAPHAPAMRANLALTLGVEPSAVSVKGKTNEGIGEIGKGEAIACHAVATIAKQ